jgi:hypothetical protein
MFKKIKEVRTIKRKLKKLSQKGLITNYIIEF